MIGLSGISEETYRLADLLVRTASGIGVIVGGVWAVYQYFIGVRKPLCERQLDLYLQACKAASVLANYPESLPEWRDAEKKFWTPYWGPLIAGSRREGCGQRLACRKGVHCGQCRHLGAGISRPSARSFATRTG